MMPDPPRRDGLLGVQGGGSAPAREWGESPTLGIELAAEGAGAELRRTSDGRVYSVLRVCCRRIREMSCGCYGLEAGDEHSGWEEQSGAPEKPCLRQWVAE